MTLSQPGNSRPEMPPEERYRLYIDESGDHVFNRLDQPSHRFLCLLGCWFKSKDYIPFQRELEDLKQRHFPHSPDEPLVLHREDLLHCRGPFWRMRDAGRRERFDDDLIGLIAAAVFRIVAVVIDKKRLREGYDTPSHPYHLAMGFLLQRYCGYLNHVNRVGDVMSESRGGRENRLLADSYSRIYERGAWMTKAEIFRQALTTRELKLKPKSANVAGLQLADLLAHPVKRAILIGRSELGPAQPPFELRVLETVATKFNRHLYDGRVEGYGRVFFPK